VLSNLPYNAPWLTLSKRVSDVLISGCTCLSVVYASNIVHAACDEEDTVWGPGKIVDFRAYRPAHGLDSPRLFVFESFFEVGVGRLIICGNPEQDVAVVSRAGQHFACGISAAIPLTCIQTPQTSWTPSDDVDSLSVLDESGEVCDFPLLAVVLHVP
jgi:hypothetical protein